MSALDRFAALIEAARSNAPVLREDNKTGPRECIVALADEATEQRDRASTAEAEVARLREQVDLHEAQQERSLIRTGEVVDGVLVQMDTSRTTISALNEQLATKDAEIARLRSEAVVADLHAEDLRDRMESAFVALGQARAAADLVRLQAKRDHLDVADALELQTIATHEQVVSAAKILSSALRDALTMLERQTRLLEGRHTPADAVNLLVMGLLGWAAEAPNSAESRGSYLGRRWVLTVQWVDGKTPGELIAEAQAERDAALGDRDEWRTAAVQDRSEHHAAIESLRAKVPGLSSAAVEAWAPVINSMQHSPWPLHSVVTTLCDAVAHLLSAHDCDTHGHEVYAEALRHGKIALLDLARPTTVTTPNDPAKDPE